MQKMSEALRQVLVLCLLLTSPWAMAVKSDLDYLPTDVQYDSNIPLPASVLGAPVGQWHARHDQIVQYMQLLAQKSPRISLIETGRTHENRQLLLLAITAEANQANLEQIRSAHMQRLAEGKQPSKSDPLVLWMGYSVHGDEPSGANAALLIAYYLAAAQGQAIDELLNNNVVLLDPSINPDGLSRFAQWANMHKGQNLVADPNHREHRQGWPNGRTNHYWFDLNRDWLLLTHPESQARIKQFQRWRPHVLTDFHEMGPNSTFFFQPGIPSRKNPFTPQQNVELTEALAQFHARALDNSRELYFTQEAYDDFYYGKGSTYPDALGSIGILFEQASSRGHLQDTINGPLAFTDTIQNQVTTSLSTFAGALATKQALLDYQQDFYKQTKDLIKNDDLRGYILSEADDASRFNALKSILQQHQIEYRGLSKAAEVDDRKYDPTNSIFVPLDQPSYRLIKSMFSTRKRFDDNSFYDVSNWNLPLAFNIQYDEVEKNLFRRLSLTRDMPQGKAEKLPDIVKGAYAYGFSWSDYNAPALLQELLEQGVQVRVAESAFSASTNAGKISFPAGSVVIPTALKQPQQLEGILTRTSGHFGIPVWSINTGLTQQGIDLGSRNMHPVKAPKVMIVGGKNTSQYEAGEVWHYLDTRVGLPVSIVELDRLTAIDLSAYTHMIWVDGNYRSVGDATVKAVETWVKNGGVLIGQTGATKWFSQQNWLAAKFIPEEEVKGAFNSNDLNFAQRDAFDAKQSIAGAVFETRLDVSHPLTFGLGDSQLPMFRNHQNIMLKPQKPFITAALYTAEPLMAGFTADELQDLIADSAAVVAHRLGKGRVIGLADNVNFRGYWYGTSRLMSNAIYLSGLIDVQG